MVTAIFPAAGQGKRMGTGRNKVFIDLMGKPILVHTLLAFSSSPLINDLIIIVAKEEVEEVCSLLKEVEGLKPWQVVAGGKERQYSIANGLQALKDQSEIILIHDGARPLISVEVIAAVIAEVKKNGAAIAAVPEKNTVKVVNNAQVVMTTPDRNCLWSVQTPQGFTREIILNAYEKAKQEGFLGTDDASLVERTGALVKVVKGDYKNIKITTPEDLMIAQALLTKKEKE